ncbi:hypothetical protein BKA81DRAFT_382134 [Phyllosticta paracitricarpa]
MHLSVEQGINVAPAAYFLSLRMLTSRCIIHVERRSTPASIECVLLASVHALLCTRSRPPANKSVDLFFGWTRRVGVRHTFPKSYSGRSTGVAAAAAAAPSSFVPALHHELGGQTGRQTEKGSVVSCPLAAAPRGYTHTPPCQATPLHYHRPSKRLFRQTPTSGRWGGRGQPQERTRAGGLVACLASWLSPPRGGGFGLWARADDLLAEVLSASCLSVCLSVWLHRVTLCALCLWSS